VVWLTAALAGNEFASTLVTGKVPPGEEDMSWFAAQHGVTPVVIDRMSREIAPSDALTVLQMFRLMLKIKPDVVHTHTAKAGTIGRAAGLLYRFATPGVLIGRPRRCRFIHTYHGHIFHSYYGRLKTSLFLTIERILARLNTDRIFVLGEQQLHEIRDVFRVGQREQFRIVPLGVDIAGVQAVAHEGEALRNELGIAGDEIVVALVGRLTAVKNIDMFLRVAARLDGRVRCVIFGDGTERGRLQSRVDEAGYTGRVVFAGTRNPSAIYAASNILALTSVNEGTPLTIIEAMANGLPVISTAVGGVVDLLGTIEQTTSDGYEIRERGITTASDDDAAFAAGVDRLLSDAALRERLGAKARPFVAANYSTARLIDDVAHVTRELAC
jgi:glycosyltransferase involved in cell wall biosynthesis